MYELQTYDLRCLIRGQRPISDKIVFVDIWDDSLQNLGAWPFDRKYHALLIQTLAQWKAQAVGLDILFAEPREGDDQVVQETRKANDVYFVEALKEPRKGEGIFISDEVLTPLLPSYAAAAKAVGHVNAPPDKDGKRRKTVPVIFYGGKPRFHLSLLMAMDALGIPRDQVRVLPGRAVEFSNKLKIPLDDEGRLIVNYAAKWEEGYPHYSYYDILVSHDQLLEGVKPLINPAKLKGKICFVGLTSTGSHDTQPIPIQNLYPMVGQHANILNSILMNDFIRRAGRLWNALILLLLSFWVGWTAFNKQMFISMLRTVLSLALFIVLTVTLFVRWGLWLDLFLPVIAVMLIYAVTTFARTIQEMYKRESIEKELKIASQIQKSFLPEKAPEHKGIGVAVYMKPAKEVGGDLYAFLKLDEDKLGIMVGDVSGKGTPAALFMAKVVSEFKFSARLATDPAAVLLNLNDSVASESTGGLFVTLTYAVFDTKARKLMLSNGGHLPVVAVDEDGKSSLITVEEGMPIGVLPGVSFGNSERVLKKGDIFAFYSDGVSEARNKKKDEYTVDRLQAVLCACVSLPVDQILERAVVDLNKFMGKADQHDDITLIVAKITE